ncbi:MAG TPA: ABC transporter ATP-binding protein [Intrasporangium sp.]|uniref:ABC transporter ATP-binding protein n=1 Tax=Intrasporangium sp. TaxID=1925024 RepID=UPI002D77714A|nr:ABC transporter ATP-binding protein [Intrasporangium sp.]HET7399645.1 ABC transporter ATP-binding protein [Intrasporangium sp.]
MTSLRISGISVSHRGEPVLRGIDLDVAAGSTTAILGPSGCGKTTLLRVVAGFQRPDAGRVEIGGRTVVDAGVWVAPERRGLGYVAQEGNLFPHLSAAENVVYGLARRERRARARVGELLELVGLRPELAERHPDQLSGGQQQRVALARALARRPAVVLLDEPFSSLDAGLRASTRDAVATALAHEGVTVVLVTHDQAEALSFADQVAIMHEGRFSQVGPPTHVYEAPADPQSASFLGDTVFLPGRLEGGAVSCALGRLPVHRPAHGVGPVDVLIRPEQVRLVDVSEGRSARVTSVAYFGHDALVSLALTDGGQAPALGEVGLSARVVGTEAPPVGTVVGVAVSSRVRTFPSG